MSQTKRSVYANALWGLITRIPHYVKRFPELIRDPVYRSSSFLSLGSVFSIGAGFLFWLVAARSYSVQEVGVATALISALNLVYCLLYTSDAADDLLCVDLGGRRII